MKRQHALSRRQFMQWSSAAGLATLLAACAPAAPGGPAVAPSGAGAAPAGDVIKIRYQSREPEQAAGIQELWNEFYPQFRAENPNVEVEFLPDPGANRRESSLAAMVAGNAPDLLEFCCPDSAYFMQKGETVNLQPLLDRDAAEVNLDDYYAYQFEPWKLDGDIHLMPRFTGTQLIYYNKDMFDAAGVEYPPSEWGAWNWEDYTGMARKFVKLEQPQTWGASNYGLNSNWLTQYWVRGWGANMVDPNDNTHCALDTDEAQESLEWMRSFIWDDNAFAYGSTVGLGVVELFLGQRIALMEMGPWNLGVQADGATFRWDVAPMPDGPAGHTTHQSVDGTMIWKGTKSPEESWTLLKWLTSPMYGRLYIHYAQKQPSRKSLLPEFPTIMREANPLYDEIQLEIFTDSIAADIGRPEEMFREDFATKDQILKPAFDRVMLLGEAPVELIARHAELATRFNRNEVTIENLGAELDKLQ